MAARSEKRTEFLRDIITTAIEGGTGYWAKVSQYQWVDDYVEPTRIRVVVGRRVGDDAHAVLHPLNDDESGYVEDGLTLDLDAVARGVSLIVSGEVRVNARLQSEIEQAALRNDAGYIDADGADVIVQAALLGSVVYG